MNLEKNINNKLSLYFIIFLMFLGCEINKKSVQSNDYNSEYEIKNKSNISLLTELELIQAYILKEMVTMQKFI